MAREIPQLVRAAAGLVATVLDEARKLPETLPGLSVRVVGLAMQTAMKLQQGYSGLVARGDEVFTGIRGEDEPGLATFDDDVEAQTGGYRESAFDRADVTFADNEVAGLPDDAAVAAVEELADQISAAQEALDSAAAEAPSTDEVLDELAIDEHLESAPAKQAPSTPAAKKAAPARKQAEQAAPAVTEGQAAVDDAVGSQPAPAAEAAPAAEPSAPETPATAETPAPEAPTAETPAAAEAPAAETPAAAEAPAAETPAVAELPDPTTGARTAPVQGYDDWSIAQLRGRLRGYAEQTVQELLHYEQATLAREPYLRMLRNRLERLRAESA